MNAAQEIDWSEQHCGVFHTPIHYVPMIMPDVYPILLDLLADERFPEVHEDYVADVKVHMLMPGQWPCIPNWHYDMVPRDDNGEQDFSRITGERMFLWLSGPPLTEFRDGREVTPGEWIPFTQYDEHRGTQSQDFCWRCFIRVAPPNLVPAAPPERRWRRHSQVYLDADNFKW